MTGYFRKLSLRQKIRNNPYYRFQSLEEVAIAQSLNITIDVNTATVDDWLRLPGFSIRQAQTLTALTATGVQFYSLEDLAAALNIPVQRLEPLAPILSFCFTERDPEIAPPSLNVNTATAEELARLPFFDQAFAETVVQNRQHYGTYGNLADFHQRLGLNSDLTSQLMHYLRFS